MGNRSSKKRTKQGAAAEDANPPADPASPARNAINQIEGDDTTKSDKPKKQKEKVKKEKVKKEKVKKEKKKKEKKEKKKTKEKAEYKELFQVTNISDGTNSVDVTNFNGDTRNLDDAVTISIKIDSDSDNMRGKENARPVTVYEGRSARPVSPKGPGVSALREKFGAKATGTPGRPVSYPATRFQSESPKSELHHPVHRKSFGFNRLEETPQKQTGKNGNADGNVSAIKQKFGATNAASPPSPPSPPSPTPPTTPTTKQTTSFATPTAKVAATPSKFGGVTNRWQPKQSNTPSETKTTSRNNVDHAVTPTTTTTTTTPTRGISGLRNRFSSNSEDRTSVKPAGQANISPEKKRRKADEEKRAEEQVHKENEKNRSPRRWSPKKESKTPSREASPTKDASPRKRKSVVLNRWSGITRSKSKHDNKDEEEESQLISKKNVDNKAEEAEKEKARQLIANRTSALIHGISSTPKPTTPSRIQSEESVPKRTRRDDRTKERPKTEYNFQNVSTPRPKSIADTNQLFSSPVNLSNMTPVQGTNIIKNPTTKTKKLLQWCQIHTQGYDGVCVSNFSSSWNDGLAFCALVHKFFPSAIRFDSLSSSNRRHNFDLAFSSAEKYAKVPRLLDTEDMIEMGDKPDYKCVFTYVTSLYAGLNKHAN